jgi:hypothetical protein
MAALPPKRSCNPSASASRTGISRYATGKADGISAMQIFASRTGISRFGVEQTVKERVDGISTTRICLIRTSFSPIRMYHE